METRVGRVKNFSAFFSTFPGGFVAGSVVVSLDPPLNYKYSSKAFVKAKDTFNRTRRLVHSYTVPIIKTHTRKNKRTFPPRKCIFTAF